MKSTLPFLSFTPSGGRIGRIAWSNGDEARWGHVRWDRFWPFQPPTPTQLSEAVAAIQQSATLMAETLISAFQHAADAINVMPDPISSNSLRSDVHACFTGPQIGIKESLAIPLQLPDPTDVAVSDEFRTLCAYARNYIEEYGDREAVDELERIIATLSQRLAISNTEEQQMTEKQQMYDEALAFFDAAQSSSQYQFGMSLRERRRQPGQ